MSVGADANSGSILVGTAKYEARRLSRGRACGAFDGLLGSSAINFGDKVMANTLKQANDMQSTTDVTQKIQNITAQIADTMSA